MTPKFPTGAAVLVVVAGKCGLREGEFWGSLGLGLRRIHDELPATHSRGGVAQADGRMNPARAGATVWI